MSAKIIDGTKLSDSMLEKLKGNVSKLKQKPVLAVILVGEDAPSLLYVEKKREACSKVGVESKLFSFCDSIPEQDVIGQIEKLNSDKKVNGILVQLPLPSNFDRNKVLETVSPSKDVDGFSGENMGKLALADETGMISCTAAGILKLIESIGARIEGSNVCIVNHSIVVGRPLAQLLLNRNATVTLCNKHTKNLAELTSKADILITAVGKKSLITAGMVKPGAIVVDAGIGHEDGKVFGDVDFAAVKEKASHITPVPGGVGPMTIACLVENTIKAAKNQRL